MFHYRLQVQEIFRVLSENSEQERFKILIRFLDCRFESFKLQHGTLRNFHSHSNFSVLVSDLLTKALTQFSFNPLPQRILPLQNSFPYARCCCSSHPRSQHYICCFRHFSTQLSPPFCFPSSNRFAK